jgi:hypothetical protein
MTANGPGLHDQYPPYAAPLDWPAREAIRACVELPKPKVVGRA